MEKVVHVARSFADAERWDIEQQIRLTPEQRQAIAGELRKRVYGPHPPDVRTSRDNARAFLRDRP